MVVVAVVAEARGARVAHGKGRGKGRGKGPSSEERLE